MLAKPFLRLFRCEVVHTVLDTIEGSTSRFNEKDYQLAKYQLCSLTEYAPAVAHSATKRFSANGHSSSTH